MFGVVFPAFEFTNLATDCNPVGQGTVDVPEPVKNKAVDDKSRQK